MRVMERIISLKIIDAKKNNEEFLKAIGVTATMRNNCDIKEKEKENRSIKENNYGQY